VAPRGAPVSAAPPRDRLAQWLSDRFPTRRLHGSALARLIYRALLGLLRPAGPLHLRTPHYRLWFQPARRDLARSIALQGPWEPWETELLRERLRPGGCIVDGGANVGHYTLIAAQAAGPGGRVIAFEPAPEPYAALLANVALNALANVTPVRAALAGRDGALPLHLDAANAGGHSLCAANLVAHGATLEVQAVRLDAWLAAHPQPASVALVKLDLQGAEVAALTGARETLRRERPLLIVEYWPYGLRNAGTDAAALLRLLSEAGYDLARIDEPTRRLVPTSAEALLAGYTADIAHSFTNLLATPRQA
jgi:FkbM family methyltransferase